MDFESGCWVAGVKNVIWRKALFCRFGLCRNFWSQFPGQTDVVPRKAKSSGNSS